MIRRGADGPLHAAAPAPHRTSAAPAPAPAPHRASVRVLRLRHAAPHCPHSRVPYHPHSTLQPPTSNLHPTLSFPLALRLPQTVRELALRLVPRTHERALLRLCWAAMRTHVRLAQVRMPLLRPPVGCFCPSIYVLIRTRVRRAQAERDTSQTTTMVQVGAAHERERLQASSGAHPSQWCAPSLTVG